MKIQQAFKYCPRCGNKTNSRHNRLSCPSCGLDNYINPKACNGLILKNEHGEIMLVERAVDPKKGYWDVPGGFLEEAETFEESTKREAKEELGIEIEDLKYEGSMVDSYDFQGVEYPTAGVMFSAKMKKGSTIKVDDDVSGYKFFPPNRLPFDKFAFAWMEKFFKEYTS
jgi:NAD+ diphosphatase